MLWLICCFWRYKVSVCEISPNEDLLLRISVVLFHVIHVFDVFRGILRISFCCFSVLHIKKTHHTATGDDLFNAV